MNKSAVRWGRVLRGPRPDRPRSDRSPASGATIKRPCLRRRLRRRIALVLSAGVVAATVVALVPTYAGASPSGTDTWNFKQARITDHVQAEGRYGKDVVVAVVDTWVDRTHPNFGGRVLRGADCLGGSCIARAASPDKCGHGTHVAGIIASKYYGVAPQARILPVRVLRYDAKTKDCTGTTTDVARGIRWATSHGADVINLSLAPDAIGGEVTTSIVTSAVQNAINHGKIVVFAAGNAGSRVADSYGGRALIVAATGPGGYLAPYSQRGVGVSVAAPGGNPGQGRCQFSNCIASTFVDITRAPIHTYALLAGTSMAAPHVSGLAALLIGEHPHRGPTNVVHAIKTTARSLSGAGSGLIDARAALAIRPRTITPVAAQAVPVRAAHVVGGSHRPEVSGQAATAQRPLRPGHNNGRSRVALAPVNDASEKLPTGPLAIAVGLLAGLAAGIVDLTRRRAVAR